MMDIGKVETNGRVPDSGFARTRIADLHLLITKLFRAAILVNTDGVDEAHAILLAAF
jgi:hypothetical protein